MRQHVVPAWPWLTPWTLHHVDRAQTDLLKLQPVLVRVDQTSLHDEAHCHCCVWWVWTHTVEQRDTVHRRIFFYCCLMTTINSTHSAAVFSYLIVLMSTWGLLSSQSSTMGTNSTGVQNLAKGVCLCVFVYAALLCVADGIRFGQLCSGNPNNKRRTSDIWGQGHYGATR